MPSSKKKSKAPARAAKKPAKPAPKPVQKKGHEKARTPPAKAPVRPPTSTPKVHGVSPAAGAATAAKSPASATGKKSSRRGGLGMRRGPGGELLVAGDILLPGGPLGPEELQYLLRGCAAAEHPAFEASVNEILAKRRSADPEGDRPELMRQMQTMVQRFNGGSIEPLLPPRPQGNRRTFQTVVDRAKLRRREIGAFLRGLDLGRTETSHMDSHGEASLQTLMEWAARLENLAEADEPDHADYAQFHRGLDQLENTTEALIVDVEATLRRLRDRVRAS